MKENKGKLKEKKGKLMENEIKWTGNKAKLKGNKENWRGIYLNSLFFKNFQKSRKMTSSEQRINQFTRRKIKGKLNGNKRN